MINFFKQIKRRRILSRILSEVREKERDIFLNFDKIGSVGVAYTVSHPNSYNEIKDIIDFLNSTGLCFVIVLFERKKGYFVKFGIEQLQSTPNIVLIPKDKFNWVGVPFGKSYNDLITNNYDLFLFCNSPHDFPMDYTAAKVNAKFTSAMCDSGRSLYTLLICGDNKQLLSSIDYVKQVFHYIKTIKTND
jgi:hypothetical protein